MFDTLINFLLGSAEKLKNLDQKTQQEITKYNNKQLKKIAIISFILGVISGIAISNKF